MSKVANFADIIKIVTMFVKTIFKDTKKVKRIRIYAPKCNLYLMSAEVKSCHVIHIFLGSSLDKI